MTSTLTFPIRANVGSASVGTLSATIAASATTGTNFSVNSGTLTNFLDVSTGAAPASGAKIVLAFEYGTANAEKMLCTYSSGTFTIQQRYYDQQSTPIGGITHLAGTTVVPVFSASEAAEHNAAVQSLVHVISGGTLGTTTDPGAVVVSGGTGSKGTSTTAAHSDHTHVLSTSSFNAALAGSTIPGSAVSGALAGSVTLDAIQLTAAASNTALPANVTMNAGQLTGAIATAQLTNASNGWYQTSSGVSLTGTSASIVSQTGVTGFSNYLITFALTATMGSTAHALAASIGINGSSVSPVMYNYLPASQIGSITATYLYATTSTATLFTVNGLAYVNAGTGTGASGTLTIIGIA